MNIFKNNDWNRIPKSDPQIKRVDMEQLDIGGRKSHLPSGGKASSMVISHVTASSLKKG